MSVDIEYKKRTRQNVIDQWYATEDDEIKALFPKSIKSLDDALKLFDQTQLNMASSYGETIYCGQDYIGDVWIFGLDEENDKMAMISIVIFDKTYWGKGIGHSALKYFTNVCFRRYDIEKIGAFVYAHNTRSANVLGSVGFNLVESFIDNDLKSYYFELYRNDMK